MYKSERSAANLKYEIPLANGHYVVLLQYAEIYFTNANKRVFDLNLESALEHDDLDLYKVAGGRNVAHDLAIPVHVQDGILHLAMPASINNGKLSAILIETAPAANQ